MTFSIEQLVWVKLPSFHKEINYWPGKIIRLISQQEKLYQILLFTRNQMYHCLEKDLQPLETYNIDDINQQTQQLLEAYNQAIQQYNLINHSQTKSQMKSQLKYSFQFQKDQTIQQIIPQIFQNSQTFCCFIQHLLQQYLNDKFIKLKFISKQQVKIPLNKQDAILYFNKRTTQMLNFLIYRTQIEQEPKNILIKLQETIRILIMEYIFGEGLLD